MNENRTQVVILTRVYRIEGEIDLLPGSRLTDFMNGANSFVVVTEAKVTDHTGKDILTGDFINVHVRNIEIILPASSAA